jgi:isocitrate dehydrogenase (NAD+)
VTLILGDGTGPELAAVTKSVLEATGVAFEWHEVEAGVDALAKYGTPLPDAVLTSIKKTKTCIKAPITTPVGTGFRSVNVALRKEFELYACLRPCKTYKGVRSRYDNIDLVIFRENTEDLYAGIEFEEGAPKTKELIAKIMELAGAKIRPDSGISIKPISISGTERIVKAAFEYALKKKRKKVTAVHKSNIMKFTDGLYLATARKVAERYPGVAFEDRIDPLRRPDARAPRRARGRQAPRGRGRARDPRGQERHLRHEGRPQRQERRRHARDGRGDHPGDGARARLIRARSFPPAAPTRVRLSPLACKP